MSAYVGKLFTAVSSALEFNTATLSGAIDIIVVEDDHGRRQCTPFHVRFGKLQLLKSRGIPVAIYLNGNRTHLRMLLGAAGEAYFYNPSSLSPDSDTLASPSSPLDHCDLTSNPQSSASTIIPVVESTPIPHRTDSFASSTQQSAFSHRSSSAPTAALSPAAAHPSVSETVDTDYPFSYISDSEVELTRTQRDGKNEIVDEPRSPPLFPPTRNWSAAPHNPPLLTTHNFLPSSRPVDGASSALPLMATHTQPPDIDDSEENGTNDGLDEHNSALFGLPASSPSSPQPSVRLVSDTPIVEAATNPTTTSVPTAHDVTVTDTLSDVVGEEDRKLDCRSLDGYEPDEELLDGLQNQVARVLTTRPSPSTPDDITSRDRETTEFATDDDANLRMGMDANAPPGDNADFLELSLCGELLTADMAEEQILELFERHRVPFDDFAVNPNLLFDSSLRFRMENRIVELRVAAPLVFAALAYNERMDVDDLAQLTAPKEISEPPDPPKSPPTPRRFRWLPWSSSAPIEGEPLLGDEDINELENSNAAEEQGRNEDDKIIESKDDGRNNLDAEEVNEEQKDKSLSNGSVILEVEKDEGNRESSVTPDNTETKDEEEKKTIEGKEETNEEPPAATQPTISFSDLDPDSLSLKPTLDELNSLDLKPGANSVRFVVESSVVELTCRIFLWSCHHKVVISDVDGTITRSDVLGHLLPAVGRDWSHVGVAGLYSQIEKNGYKLMYLTARPIGQASQTRAFLHGVTQGSAKLPNGPVLMSPNRLVESFTREVIRRKPHEFKIAALRELRSLFSPADNPFYAGYGNRDTDVISYRAVGLMPQRIFVVNPKGELVVMKSRFESAASYSTLQDLVESVFPDISGKRWLAKTQAMTENATYNDWNYWKGSLPTVDLDGLLNS